MTNALYPIAKKRPKLKTFHGEVSTDDYAWLRDDNWQKVMREPETLNPEIRSYLDLENSYTDTLLAPLSGTIETLFAEMKGRIQQKDASVPLPDGIAILTS